MNERIIGTIAFLLAAMLFTSISAFADCGGSNGTRCAEVQIERLYVTQGTTILVGTDGDESRLVCQPVEGQFIELRDSHPRFKELYAMLLSAQLANHTITIRVRTAEDSPCSILYAILE